MGDLGFTGKKYRPRTGPDGRTTRQKDPKTGQFLPGNTFSRKHGVEVFLQTGKLPSVRGKRLLNKYLQRLEKDLRAALGGSPTPQQEVLIRQVLRAEGVLRLIEIWLQRVPAISSKGWRQGRLELQPCLSQSYGFFLNVQRQATLALGLDRKGLEEKWVSPEDLLKEAAEEQARDEKGPQDAPGGSGSGDKGGTQPGGGADPGSSGGDMGGDE